MLVRPAALSPAGGFDTIPPPVSHSPSGTRPNYTHSGGAALPMISVSVGARDSYRALAVSVAARRHVGPAPRRCWASFFWRGSRAAAFLVMAVRNRGPSTTSRQLSQQGASALYRQDWQTAESFFARAVEACPQDVDARRHYAEALWHRGARRGSDHATGRSNQDIARGSAVVGPVGGVSLDGGPIAQAHHDAETAIDLDPRSPDAWMVRGRIMHRLGDNRQALADLHRG